LEIALAGEHTCRERSIEPFGGPSSCQSCKSGHLVGRRIEAVESFNAKPLSNRRHVPSLQRRNEKCPSELTKYQGGTSSKLTQPPSCTSIRENNNRPESPNGRNIPTIARERGEELSRSVEAINYTEQKLKTQRDQRIRMQRYAGLQAMGSSTVLWSRPHKVLCGSIWIVTEDIRPQVSVICKFHLSLFRSYL